MQKTKQNFNHEFLLSSAYKSVNCTSGRRQKWKNKEK